MINDGGITALETIFIGSGVHGTDSFYDGFYFCFEQAAHTFVKRADGT
ncbi:hypothetical protein MUS_1059 [Bacillus velezensis YAU B9601-Y2]|uniref:Uncharacterized protein n=1 Tax=Bacillus amyloliquefaciens (strain Y2) TaxID=1155777 RepID=I2C366_BACAY|nr:hypothetical protein MUS_1059 [Bacillus velezensis YAU B9601-Y2]